MSDFTRLAKDEHRLFERAVVALESIAASLERATAPVPEPEPEDMERPAESEERCPQCHSTLEKAITFNLAERGETMVACGNCGGVFPASQITGER